MLPAPSAGRPADEAILVNVPRLITAYYSDRPDPSVASQRVVFGTSGHRGSAFEKAFNEWHILAITQAICLYRAKSKIDGPLFLGIDAHALSVPALASALEVLAANGVEVMLSQGDEYTPTPVVSHAILAHNRGRRIGLADGIVVTPSHNPPRDGGFKYNPPNGGPASSTVTDWIEARSNRYLEAGLAGLKRIPVEATPEQKERLAKLSPEQIRLTELAGDRIQAVLTRAPGNGAAIGGLKVVTKTGWFAARPSGTESIYKIYAESFQDGEHLRRIVDGAQSIVSGALAAAPISGADKVNLSLPAAVQTNTGENT